MKPCPFCGGEAIEVKKKSDYPYYNPKGTIVKCRDCGIKKDNVEEWNKRINDYQK